MFAKVKKELPECLVIAALLWAVKIAADYKGFYPITWTIVILATAITMSVIVMIRAAALGLVWSLIKRILFRRASTRANSSIVGTICVFLGLDYLMKRDEKKQK